MTTYASEALSDSVLRRAFGAFPSGVTAVCALVDGEPVGMAASSFTSVSLAPPLVSVCMAHTSTTWPRLRGAARLGVSVLSADHVRTAQLLASKVTSRFAQVDWSAGADGAVFIGGSPLQLECEVASTVRAGDHDIIVLRVCALEHAEEVAPMVFHNSSFRLLAL